MSNEIESSIYKFNVIWYGKCIKTVTFEFPDDISKDEMEEEVKDVLVYYDGYNGKIKVERQ